MKDPKAIVLKAKIDEHIDMYPPIPNVVSISIHGGDQNGRKAKLEQLGEQFRTLEFKGKVAHAVNAVLGGIDRNYEFPSGATLQYRDPAGPIYIGIRHLLSEPEAAFPPDKKDAINEALLNKVCELIGAQKETAKGKAA